MVLRSFVKINLLFRIMDPLKPKSPKYEKVVFNGEQEKIHYLCEDGIEKSVPRDHLLSV